MRSLPLLLLLLLGFSATAQLLDKDEAHFFAKALHERDVLTVEGYNKLLAAINKGTSGLRAPRLVVSPGPQPIRISNLIGYLVTEYFQEHRYRIAQPQLQDKAMTMFGTPAPLRLSPGQEEELLTWARKELADAEGPGIERALGHDVYAEGSLPPHFMQFASSSSISRANSESNYPSPVYLPSISPSRSVLGYDVTTLLDVLEELGIILAKDRAQLRQFPSGKIQADQYVLSELARIVDARESRPQNIADNLAYLKQVNEFGLLNDRDFKALRNDSSFLHGFRKLPVIKRFQRGVTSMNPGYLTGQEEGLKNLVTTLRELDPAFKDLNLKHTVNPNEAKPTRPYEDGPDLTIFITGKNEELEFTVRTSRRSVRKDGKLSYRMYLGLIGSLNEYLAASGSLKKLYCVKVRPDLDKETSKPTRETIFVLLSEQEAKTVIPFTKEEMFMGPDGFARRR